MPWLPSSKRIWYNSCNHVAQPVEPCVCFFISFSIHLFFFTKIDLLFIFTAFTPWRRFPSQVFFRLVETTNWIRHTRLPVEEWNAKTKQWKKQFEKVIWSQYLWNIIMFCPKLNSKLSESLEDVRLMWSESSRQACRVAFCASKFLEGIAPSFCMLVCYWCLATPSCTFHPFRAKLPVAPFCMGFCLPGPKSWPPWTSASGWWKSGAGPRQRWDFVRFCPWLPFPWIHDDPCKKNLHVQLDDFLGRFNLLPPGAGPWERQQRHDQLSRGETWARCACDSWYKACFAKWFGGSVTKTY